MNEDHSWRGEVLLGKNNCDCWILFTFLSTSTHFHFNCPKQVNRVKRRGISMSVYLNNIFMWSYFKTFTSIYYYIAECRIRIKESVSLYVDRSYKSIMEYNCCECWVTSWASLDIKYFRVSNTMSMGGFKIGCSWCGWSAQVPLYLSSR